MSGYSDGCWTIGLAVFSSKTPTSEPHTRSTTFKFSANYSSSGNFSLAKQQKKVTNVISPFCRCHELRHIMLVTGQDEEEEYQRRQSEDLTKIGNDLARWDFKLGNYIYQNGIRKRGYQIVKYAKANIVCLLSIRWFTKQIFFCFASHQSKMNEIEFRFL